MFVINAIQNKYLKKVNHSTHKISLIITLLFIHLYEYKQRLFVIIKIFIIKSIHAYGRI